MADYLNQFNQIVQGDLGSQSTKSKKIWLWLLVFITLVALFFFLPKFFVKDVSRSQGKNLANKEKASQTSFKKLAASFLPSSFSSSQEEINILLLGAAGPGNDAPDLTDTIVLAKINPSSSNDATLISIPRDLWVKVPETNFYAKINSLYALGKNSKDENYGLELVKQEVEEITGQKIDYYVFVDLSVVKKVIDSLGGINVWVEKDIYDPQFPGPNHSYQTFQIQAGWRYMDGETASKYVRTRHSVAGDFDRIGRQQQVLEALKQKVAGLHPVWDLPSLLKVLNNIWSQTKTNLPLTEVPQFWQIAKNISPDNIKNIVIDRDENNLLASGQIWLGNEQASILKPKAGLENYEEIQEFIDKNQ
ncbi:MAG: LCP family protein [Candidatus Portnoybacteria bacterium]|nr:LCP family protein [Candidatus Portnoybacteria bacterium]